MVPSRHVLIIPPSLLSSSLGSIFTAVIEMVLREDPACLVQQIASCTAMPNTFGGIGICVIYWIRICYPPPLKLVRVR